MIMDIFDHFKNGVFHMKKICNGRFHNVRSWEEPKKLGSKTLATEKRHTWKFQVYICIITNIV